jgi:hypothetical protein
MKPLSTYFNLTFQAGKVILGIRKVAGIFSEHDYPLYGLSQKKLVVKRDISSPVLQ